MPYATLQQLTDRFGARMLVELTDRGELATGVIDQAAVDRALADADAAIDARLLGRYRLPLAVVPALLVDLALAVAIYKLHAHSPDPKIRLDYEDALRTLAGIATGAVRLDIQGVEPATTGGGGARVTDRERPFSADTMKGFI